MMKPAEKHDQLIAFDSSHAGTVLGWVRSPEDLLRWAGREDHPLTDRSVFTE